MVATSPQRAQLLAVAAALADQCKLEQLSASRIAEAANLTEADFLAAFASLDEYLIELHQQFMAGILESIVARSGNMPVSLERITSSAEAQLDTCLQQRSLRGLLVEARRKVPKLAEIFHRRNQTTAMMIGMELKNLGCAQSTNTGRYYCMMVLEAAQIEADAAAVVPEARKALADFLKLMTAGVKPA